MTKPSGLNQSSLTHLRGLTQTGPSVLGFSRLIVFKQKELNPDSGGIGGIFTILFHAGCFRSAWESSDPASSPAQLPASSWQQIPQALASRRAIQPQARVRLS